MKEYEVIKDVYSPCAPDTQEFLELELENPEAYVRDIFKNDKSAEISVTETDDGMVIEVVCEAAQRHRFTFTEI